MDFVDLALVFSHRCARGRSRRFARADASDDSRGAASGIGHRRRNQVRPRYRRANLPGGHLQCGHGHGELAGRGNFLVRVGRLFCAQSSAWVAAGQPLLVRVRALAGSLRPEGCGRGFLAPGRPHSLASFAHRGGTGGDHRKKNQQLPRFRNLFEFGPESPLRPGLVAPEMEGVLPVPIGARCGLFSRDPQPGERTRRNP